MTKDSDRTSSQADFLANLSVSQEKENLRKMTEISGRKLLGLSKSPDPLGLLEKMLVESLNSISTPYLRTWKVQTTPRGALIFQLRASVQTIKGKESGLLPTPRTSDQNTPSMVRVRKIEEGMNWHKFSLRETLLFLKKNYSKKYAPPILYEILMGYQTEWTELNLSETQSAHKSHTTSDKS